MQGIYYRSPERKAELKRHILSVHRKGKHRPESIEKIRQSKIGKKRTFTKEWIEKLRQASIRNGNKPPINDLTGFRHSAESRLKMSKAQQKLAKWKGDKNPHWNGGVSSENLLVRSSPEYVRWRLFCMNRDGFRCYDCGQKGGSLCVDHIYPFSLFPRLRLDVNNGRTLCVPCHQKTDTYAGKIYSNSLFAEKLKVAPDTLISTLI